MAPLPASSSADWLQRCVVAVQSASINEIGWADALATIRDVLGAPAAALETWDHRHHSSWGFITSGLDAEGAARVHALFPDTNPRLEANTGILEGEVTYDYLHWDEQQLSRLDYIRAMEEQTGTRYFLAGVALKSRNYLGAVTFFREPGQGHFSQESIERLRVLLPVLRLGLQTSILLDEQRTLARLAIDESTGLVLLNDEGRVVFVNATAQRMERKGLITGLQLDHLRCEAPRGQMSALVEAAMQGRAGAIRLGDVRGGPFLEVRAIPLPAAAAPFEPFHATAALVISDPLSETRADTDALGSLFGLSDREQEVAQMLLAGRTTAQVASLLQISRETVRVHIRNLLQKTGTHSQHQLVARLSNYR
jgi:DNA-binding CsgD family transcriptional regulator